MVWIRKLVVTFALTICATLLFTAAVPALTAAPPSADELHLLNLINLERRKHNIAPLQTEPRLQLVARRYSAEMVKYNFFGHTSPRSGSLRTRITRSGVPTGWLLAGENLAGAPTAQAAFKGLMGSSAHKANMLNPKYTHVGIGVANGGPYGKYFTLDLIAYPKNLYFKSNVESFNFLVFVNGSPLFSDPSPFITEGRLVVPVSESAEALGANASWNPSTKEITLNNDATTVALKLGNRMATVNGTERELDSAPFLYNNRPYVPLRFIAESLGARLTWNSRLRIAEVTIP